MTTILNYKDLCDHFKYLCEQTFLYFREGAMVRESVRP